MNDDRLERQLESAAVKPKSGVLKKNGKVVARYGDAKEEHDKQPNGGFPIVPVKVLGAVIDRIRAWYND